LIFVFASGVLTGLATAICGIYLDRHIRNYDLMRSTWRYIRYDISENLSIINNWISKIKAENKYLEEEEYILEPLPPFRDEFWYLLLNKMPDKGLKNDNLVHHIRLLNQSFSYLNICSKERQLYKRRGSAQGTKKANDFLLKELNKVKTMLEKLDKQYSIIIRFAENEKEIYKKILKEDKVFKPIEVTDENEV